MGLGSITGVEFVVIKNHIKCFQEASLTLGRNKDPLDHYMSIFSLTFNKNNHLKLVKRMKLSLKYTLVSDNIKQNHSEGQKGKYCCSVTICNTFELSEGILKAIFCTWRITEQEICFSDQEKRRRNP